MSRTLIVDDAAQDEAEAQAAYKSSALGQRSRSHSLQNSKRYTEVLLQDDSSAPIIRV